MLRLLTATLATLIVLSTVQSASSADLEITFGAFSFNPPYAHQLISVENTTNRFFRMVSFECGFLEGQAIVAVGTAHVENLKPHETGFGEALGRVPAQRSATAARCRIVSAR